MADELDKRHREYITRIDDWNPRARAWAERQVRKLSNSAPIVSEVLYARRDRVLKNEGFLHWERFWLCQHQMNSAGARIMRRDRRQFFAEFGVTFQNYNDYRRAISDRYREMGWVFMDGRLNPFKMLEDYKRRAAKGDTPQPKQRRVKKGHYKTRNSSTKEKRVELAGHAEYQRKHRL